jgi:hypothetical protein
MKSRNCLLVLVTVTALTFGISGRAAAQPRAEIGGSLANLIVDLEDEDDTVVFGVPSASFGLFNPGVYASFFLGPNAAIEPQLGLVWVSSGGDSMHVVTAAAQFDYFFNGLERRSVYAFAAGGVTDVSESSTTPKSVSAGMGIRTPVGDRLTFRFDGRYMHFTEGGGNALSFSVSIGGVFGR